MKKNKKSSLTFISIFSLIPPAAIPLIGIENHKILSNNIVTLHDELNNNLSKKSISEFVQNDENGNNQISTSAKVSVNLPFWGNESNNSKEVNYKYISNLDYLRKLFLGNGWKKEIFNSFSFESEQNDFDNELFTWSPRDGYEANFGLFSKLLDNELNVNNTKNFKLDNSNISFNSLSGRFSETKWIATDGKDRMEIYLNTNWVIDIENETFAINTNVYSKVKDVAAEGQHGETVSIKSNSNVSNLAFNVLLPYSMYDVNLFIDTFKNTMAKPIVLEKVRDPVIFNYSPDSENEKRVVSVINERINKFINDSNIINSKLGPISIFDESTNSYKLNEDAGVIEYEVPKNARGSSGSQQVIRIRYKLPEGRTFEFFDSKNKDKLEFDLVVQRQLDISNKNNIDDLITITPYKGSSDSYEDNFITKNYLNCRLGQNDPLSDAITLNQVNINEAKYIQNNGNQNLVVEEKFPIISRIGTLIKIKLNIKLGTTQFVEELEFDRVFTNGKVYLEHTISNSSYDSSNIKIKDSKISLILEIKENKILLYGNKKIELISSNNSQINVNSCSVDVNSVSISVPSEQMQANSTWIQIEAGKYFKDKDDENNVIRYAGSYKIYDPFFFMMQNIMIDAYDPVTLKPLGTFSKYKPYLVSGECKINDDGSITTSGEQSQIYPSASDKDSLSQFNANLGPYIMANQPVDNGTFKFHILIKEFDNNSTNQVIEEKYTKNKWVLNLEIELIDSESTLQMLGYKDNQIISEINEQKYFNEKDVENYRGDFANKETGMYIPKIVWVNSYPPESFLYDPRDKNGELIVPLNATNEQILNAKYDIGYIAQLNGTAFATGDYASNISFGGFEIIFDQDKFTPDGIYPYIEKYTFNKNSIEPTKERVSLSSSGLQVVDSNYNFGQIVLKRPSSNTYLYQFFKINTRNEILKYKQDLISIYGNYNGLKDQPLFVDFWSTYHGNNLKRYLIDKKLIEDEDKIQELEYSDVIQYWNIYVNDPDNYNSLSLSGNDLSKLGSSLGYELVSSNNLETLKQNTILALTKKLNDILFKQGWINNELTSGYDEKQSGFRIEENEDVFNAKLELLLNEYDKNLNEASLIDFNVIINDEYFEDKPIKVSGKNKISILNNKDIDKIIDLSKYKGTTLLINTSDSSYDQSSQYKLIQQVSRYIYDSIDKDILNVIKNSQLDLNGYVPKENVDYQLKFRDQFGNYYQNIDEAIRSILLTGVEQSSFDNNLFIEIEAIFDNNSHFMKNSFQKIINNNSNNPAYQEVDNFDLSLVKPNNLKVNTTKDGILVDETYWNASDESSIKAKGLWKLIKDMVIKDVNLYSRKWINSYNIDLSLGQNYEIKLIKSFDENNNPIYFECNNDQEYEQVILDSLLSNIENNNEFNNDLMIEVCSINSDSYNTYTINSFRKKINNSYLNEGIDDGNLENSFIDTSDKADDLSNGKAKGENLNMWWIITPLTIFGILGIIVIVIILVRKNRRIR